MRKLIYIQAVGHSGSTLLSRLLNLHPAVFSLGSFREVEMVASDDVDSRCGCGKKAFDCDVWSSAFRSLPSEPRRLMFRNSDGRMSRIQLENSWSLISALQESTGVSSICELTHDGRRVTGYAEKRPQQLLLVHLVRDPRAILRSYFRLLKPRTWFARVSLSLKISLFYLRRHVYTIILSMRYRKSGVKYIRVRYEDLCANANEVLAGIFEAAGLESIEVSTLYGAEENHILGGNVVRFKPIETVADGRRFLDYFSWANLTFLTLINLPSLLVFRYPVFFGRIRRGA